MSVARIESDSRVRQLDGKAEPDEVVTEEDAKEPSKVSRLLARLLKEVAALKRRHVTQRLDFEDVPVGGGGAVTQLAHHFGGRVRWSVVGWQTLATPTTDNLLCSATSWMMRGLWGPGTLATAAGNFTNGVRFRCTSACTITGARFLWKAATRTVKATLWLDSSGAVLATGTVSCTDSGVYTVAFSTPIVPTLNVDMTLGIYDQAGTAYTSTGVDTPWTNLLPLALPGLSLRLNKLFLAGDNRPTSSAVSELYWMEPILGPPLPQLIENTSRTDNDTLALTSYAAGTATIRVEAAG